MVSDHTHRGITFSQIAAHAFMLTHSADSILGSTVSLARDRIAIRIRPARGALSRTMSTPALPLAGKITIVTGASRGIGAAIALDLARRGASVALTYTSASSQSSVDALLQQISALPHAPPAMAVRVDLGATEAPATVVAEAARAFGTDAIDIIVNNAGVDVQCALADVTPEEFARAFDLNVRAPALLLAATASHLRPHARVVNVSSVAGAAGYEGFSLYCASKAALEGLTRAWAAELGKNGTTANCVCPGPIESDMLARIPDKIVSSQKAATPVENRVGTPEEVASVVGWLAGPEAGWVTGQCISVSGGFQMRG
jgi:3-oxoacyl-[acyl-carrier protein] reductase